MTKMKMVGISLLLTLPLLYLLANGFGHDPHAVPSMLEGKPAPNFSLQSLEGTTVELQKLRGKPVVLNFWATWCYPCQTEHPLLQSAAQHYGDKVQFLGVIYQDSAEQMRKHLANKENHFPQLIDPDSKVAIDYGIAGVPETYFITSAGSIVHKQAGVLTHQTLHEHIAAMLSDAS